MAARVEALQEQLAAIRTRITATTQAGQPAEDLIEEERGILRQLGQARNLLNESASLLKG